MHLLLQKELKVVINAILFAKTKYNFEYLVKFVHNYYNFKPIIPQTKFNILHLIYSQNQFHFIFYNFFQT